VPHPLRKVEVAAAAQDARLPSLAELGTRWFAGDDGDISSLGVFRETLGSWHLALEEGITAQWERSLKELDTGARHLTGQGIGRTPLVDASPLARALGLDGKNLFLKNETLNLLGSHKSRHHMGAILYLEMLRLGKTSDGNRSPLAIFSCGNAAMGASAVAGAMGYPLYTFVPFGISPTVESILSNLGAMVMEVRRDGVVGEGDPCFNRYHDAVAHHNLLPFSCYGRDSWPSIEGGEAMGLEFLTQIALREQGGKTLAPATLDALIIQVGGGGLAHSVVDAIESALALGLLTKRPRLYLVQTESVYPLVRGYGQLAALAAKSSLTPFDATWSNACKQGKPHRLDTPSAENFRAFRSSTAENIAKNPAILTSRSALSAGAFGPWGDNLPDSLADGILDDTTYDGYEIACESLRSGGYPFTVSEEELAAAHALVREKLSVDASATGTAAIAGLTALCQAGEILPTERTALILTGVGHRTAFSPTVRENIRVVGPNDRLAFFG
jgi:threonine dehydratase